jgi:predicted HTH transcriptional regulator
MYDSIEELLTKVRLGEDATFEMKTVRFSGSRIIGPARDDLADELASFANTAEGVVLLGVDDKTKDITGIPVEKLEMAEAFVRDICNDSIKPPLLARIVRMEMPDSTGQLKPIIRIDVPRSLFVHESPHGYFHRIGSSKRKMTPEILQRLFQQRSQARIVRFDEQPVPETTAKDLDEDLTRRFLKVQTEGYFPVLRKLKILTIDETGSERLSVGGVLMCTRHPERWLSGALVEAVSYRGTKRDGNYQQDARIITGPLDAQIMETLSFISKNMRRSAVKQPERIETPQFSLRAVFEAVVNAAAHRDYSIYASKIRCFIFDDRLEIYSPGPPPNTVSLESLSLRQATRNELITSFLSNCSVLSESDTLKRRYFMEKRGEGVPIILDESLRLSSRTPEYKLIDNTELLLTIWSAKQD